MIIWQAGTSGIHTAPLKAAPVEEVLLQAALREGLNAVLQVKPCGKVWTIHGLLRSTSQAMKLARTLADESTNKAGFDGEYIALVGHGGFTDRYDFK
jgi:hypothetical protein